MIEQVFVKALAVEVVRRAVRRHYHHGPFAREDLEHALESNCCKDIGHLGEQHRMAQANECAGKRQTASGTIRAERTRRC